MMFKPLGDTLLLPKIEIACATNSRQLEKRFAFLWSSAHRLLGTNDVLANHMIASMMQLVKASHVQLPQSVLDYICETCGGLLVPSVTSDVRVVPQSRKSRANRRLVRQQRRVKLQSDVTGTRLVRETLSSIVRVTCYRCKHRNDRSGASVVHKAKIKKRVREEQQTATIASNTKKMRMGNNEAAATNDTSAVVQSVTAAAASVELKMAPTGVLVPVPSSVSRKLLDGSKKRTKKTQPDAAVLAVKNSLSSFLEGLHY